MTGEEMRDMREDALSGERAAEFELSLRAVREWERSHPMTLEQALAWMESLRRLFGDPPVDLEPWRGSDFRL
jgi:hypothetical protein